MKIPDISALVKKTDYNAKITETENKIPDICSLAKKTDYDVKITENDIKNLLIIIMKNILLL